MNVVLLEGVLSSEPRTQTLASGSLLMKWELTTCHGEHKLTVPVSWFDPPASLQGLGAGEGVVVLGTVRRRFFQLGGRLQSATDVQAERAAPVRRKRQATRVVEAALERLAGRLDAM